MKLRIDARNYILKALVYTIVVKYISFCSIVLVFETRCLGPLWKLTLQIKV